MNTFKLNIVTPDGEKFSGDAISLLARGTEGDLQILAGHIDIIAALGIGRMKIKFADGEEKIAACGGGFLSVSGGEVRVVATTLEYSEEIDAQRAARAKEKAEERLSGATEDREIRIAKAKLMRAISRISVSDRR